MAQRTNWQYCQIEVGGSGGGVLRQFFADRSPVEHDLQSNWPSMLGKLGEQGWEMVNAVSTERGKGGMIYIFKRSRTTGPISSGSAYSQQQNTQYQDYEEEEPPEDPSPLSGFKPLHD